MKNSCFIHIFILSTLMFYVVPGFSGNVTEADSAYIRQDYAHAVELYEEIIRSDGESSEIFYNLGNAYTKGGDYGHAALYYLRALKLDPGNKLASKNLDYIDSKVLESNKNELRGKKFSLETDSSSFFVSAKNYIAGEHPSDFWAVWAAICFILFAVCVGLYIFVRQILLRKIGFFGGFVFFGISAITLAFAFMSASYQSDEGVIIAPKIKLFSEANKSSKEGPVSLTRGTRLKILESFPADSANPQWYKVRLNSDFVGWISSSDFIPVENYLPEE